MNPLLTNAVSFVVSMGVGSIVGNAIKASTPATTPILQKIVMGVGGVALSSLVGSLAAKQSVEKIDETVAQIQGGIAVLRKKEDI